jgi:hypothetical protein
MTDLFRRIEVICTSIPGLRVVERFLKALAQVFVVLIRPSRHVAWNGTDPFLDRILCRVPTDDSGTHDHASWCRPTSGEVVFGCQVTALWVAVL